MDAKKTLIFGRKVNPSINALGPTLFLALYLGRHDVTVAAVPFCPIATAPWIT